jgi:hypothetical protein
MKSVDAKSAGSSGQQPSTRLQWQLTMVVTLSPVKYMVFVDWG